MPSPQTPPIDSAVPYSASCAEFGSDVVAQTLRDVCIPYVALNPGASFRGLHDSLVNYLGNRNPSILLCLHEEHAVAIAHGYAKVTGRPMAAAVHSNVGLMHATMAIFNAWCDRMPILVIGATGPVDAAKRRPWIDWIHTARDQAALVRQYVKWDDQPASVEAARESILRAVWIAKTVPHGPVYINLDAQMQEAGVESKCGLVDPTRVMPKAHVAVPSDALSKAIELLEGAENPVFLIGRVSRDAEAWEARIDLAETIGAKVLTDIKVGAAFPTHHPLHVGSPGYFLDAEAVSATRGADVILSLDWVDLGGTLGAIFETDAIPTVIHTSLDHVLHNGWTMDHQALPVVDLLLACDTNTAVSDLLARCRSQKPNYNNSTPNRQLPNEATDTLISMYVMGLALHAACVGHDTSLVHLPISWNGSIWPFSGPLDYLGSDGGAGIGAGPGIAVGAALALRDHFPTKLPIAVCGDGDYFMGVTALWTAVHYRIPLLIVVANNRSFYNDEVHQERVARMRGRPIENKWIGQKILNPEMDVCGIARSQGAIAFGPVTDCAELNQIFAKAIEKVKEGAVVVVDVRVEPGYSPAMTSRLTE